MKYIWEILLLALQQGLDRDSLRFLPDLKASPYVEASFEELNADTLWDAGIEVNPLYRFTHIFASVFDIDLEKYSETRNMLFDTFMHYQAQLDLRQGLTKDEYYIRAILRDIISGAYGKRFSEDCKLFSNVEMKNILHCLLTLNRVGVSIELFRKAVRSVYPKALVYRNNNVYREILIYIPWDKTDKEMRKLDFLVSMFLDVNYTVYIFWKYHFGIIGVDETLEYDNFLIF